MKSLHVAAGLEGGGMMPRSPSPSPSATACCTATAASIRSSRPCLQRCSSASERPKLAQAAQQGVQHSAEKRKARTLVYSGAAAGPAATEPALWRDEGTAVAEQQLRAARRAQARGNCAGGGGGGGRARGGSDLDQLPLQPIDPP